MTANEIIIPLCGVALLAGFVYLRIRNLRFAAKMARKQHGPNAPRSQHDKAAIARSASHGLGTGSANQ